ncbi:unnamed protein product [Polarella glacialis]|uniref:C3H1-type domain-containing protein n=1 Tax=Polarella glacialis TaxID=89957 RepID=A0A813FSH3_POLGL|nr:unnamed protein product [Polarella glacialis]
MARYMLPMLFPSFRDLDYADDGSDSDSDSDTSTALLHDPDASDVLVTVCLARSRLPVYTSLDEHAKGTCKPCLFHVSRPGCARGISCQFCHSHIKRKHRVHRGSLHRKDGAAEVRSIK